MVVSCRFVGEDNGNDEIQGYFCFDQLRVRMTT
jgi:hypothetical protein